MPANQTCLFSGWCTRRQKQPHQAESSITFFWFCSAGVWPDDNVAGHQLAKWVLVRWCCSYAAVDAVDAVDRAIARLSVYPSIRSKRDSCRAQLGFYRDLFIPRLTPFPLTVRSVMGHLCLVVVVLASVGVFGDKRCRQWPFNRARFWHADVDWCDTELSHKQQAY